MMTFLVIPSAHVGIRGVGYVQRSPGRSSNMPGALLSAAVHMFFSLSGTLSLAPHLLSSHQLLFNLANTSSGRQTFYPILSRLDQLPITQSYTML